MNNAAFTSGKPQIVLALDAEEGSRLSGIEWNVWPSGVVIERIVERDAPREADQSVSGTRHQLSELPPAPIHVGHAGDRLVDLCE